MTTFGFETVLAEAYAENAKNKKDAEAKKAAEEAANAKVREIITPLVERHPFLNFKYPELYRKLQRGLTPQEYLHWVVTTLNRIYNIADYCSDNNVVRNYVSSITLPLNPITVNSLDEFTRSYITSFAGNVVSEVSKLPEWYESKALRSIILMALLFDYNNLYDFVDQIRN